MNVYTCICMYIYTHIRIYVYKYTRIERGTLASPAAPTNSPELPFGRAKTKFDKQSLLKTTMDGGVKYYSASIERADSTGNSRAVK